MLGFETFLVYLNYMQIVWDEIKRRANMLKHGFDFAELDWSYFEQAKVLPTVKGRLMAIGRLRDGTVTVIFAKLGSEGISIISMRRASAAERRIADDR